MSIELIHLFVHLFSLMLASAVCFISNQAALAKDKKNILYKNIEVEISEIFLNIPEADLLVCNIQSNLLT